MTEQSRNRLFGEPDAEFELLLSNEHDELKSMISHYEQIMESISALCVLERNGVMDPRRVVSTIETILKGGE